MLICDDMRIISPTLQCLSVVSLQPLCRFVGSSRSATRWSQLTPGWTTAHPPLWDPTPHLAVDVAAPFLGVPRHPLPREEVRISEVDPIEIAPPLPCRCPHKVGRQSWEFHPRRDSNPGPSFSSPLD